MSLFEQMSSMLFTTLRVAGSTLSGPHSAVLIGGKGAGGLSFDDQDEEGDGTPDADAFGAPGVVWRPRPPESIGAENIGAETIAARGPDGATPLSWRDLRWNRAYPNPAPGTTAFVGYAGGFLAFEDVGSAKDQRCTIYVPYDKNSNGVAQKAHAITVDPNGAITLIQGDGYAFTLDESAGIVARSKTGQSWFELKDNAFNVVAATINLRGTVALGSNTAAAIPLLAGPASQPTPSVLFSPT